MLATVVNCIDRQALTVTAKRIKSEMRLTNEDYGWLETGFGLAFALGQTLLGWQPLFLQEGRGYSESTMLGFNAAFYVAADIGCLATGAIALGLQRRGLSLPRARLLVYFACCLLTACATLAAFLPAGPGLLAVLLVVGCGSLGLFPFFYALSQELSERHQGKVIGVLGTSAWLALSLLHPVFGRYIDATGSFDLGLAVIGWVPLVSCFVLWRFWPCSRDSSPNAVAEATS